MSTILTSTSESKVVVGLGTFVHTALKTSLYTVVVSSTVYDGSALSSSITQNSTLIATSPTIAPHQRQVNVQAVLNCTAGDTISIALTSSNAIDQQLNSIQTIIQIEAGVP